MKTLTDIFLLTLIVVFIVDISGVMESIKGFLSKWLNGKVARLRPFDCSLCMTFWLGLIVALIDKQFTFGVVAYVCLCSYLTIPLRGLLELIKDILVTIINKLNDIL